MRIRITNGRYSREIFDSPSACRAEQRFVDAKDVSISMHVDHGLAEGHGLLLERSQKRVSHAAIVENKRLGEILAWIKEQQDRQPRFNRVPDGPRRSSQKPGILKNRALQITEAAKSRPKAHRRGRRRCDMEVSAAPAQAASEAAE